MKKISVFLILAFVISLFAGCAGTTVVYYSDCTCPEGSHVSTPETTPATEPVVPADTSVKTGLYIGTNISSSSSAADGAEGVASYDVTIVAVTVDQSGIITGCIIDSLPASVGFDANGNITTDLSVAPLTKNELGAAYGMGAISPIGKEWNEQAAALANYAIGKTVEELKNGALNESGKAKDADLATQATIYLGGYVSAIEAAVANAQFLGANAGDTLKMAIIPNISSSAAATAEKDGTAQLDVDVAVVTMNGDVFTSCYIDSLQAKVSFNASGVITTDLTAPVLTKNELGTAYGMGQFSPIGKEWNEQAAAFASYVTGKTAADIAGITFTEGKPDDVDLASSVTIYIGGFQNLIQKAAQ